MYTVIIHFLPNQAIYKWIIVRVWLVKILTVEIKSSLTTRKFSPSPEVVSLTGSCLNSSQRKYLSEFLTHRFPNFRKKSFGISRPWYDWKNKCFDGLKSNDFDKKSSELTKMPKFDSFCNFFFSKSLSFASWSTRLKSGSQTRHSSFSIFLIFWIWPIFEKTARGQTDRVWSNRVVSKMINKWLKWGAPSWSD